MEQRNWDTTKVGILLGLTLGVFALDITTKLMIQNSFHLYQQVQVVGDYLRLTYIYNPGAAFGISVGPYSREIFLIASVVALVVLIGLYWYASPTDRTRQVAIALICGGALGNMLDRIRSERGVVDFLDLGIGDLRWPIFNVADIAVTTGAILLALSIWREGRDAETSDPAVEH